jgi:hypothetical protein
MGEFHQEGLKLHQAQITQIESAVIYELLLQEMTNA